MKYIDEKIDIEKLLKEYKDSTQKILELLDESVLPLVNEEGLEKEMKEQDVQELAVDAELFWRKYYKKRFKTQLLKMAITIGQVAEIPVQSAFYRGILFAYQEERDWFNKQVGISAENRKKPETSSEIKTAGELNL
jgi:hypothetical protein